MTEPTQKSAERIRTEWTLGTYPNLARAFMDIAAVLVDGVGVEPGERVLDVACGTGNAAVTAHRRGGDVTGVDITPAMLERAREHASVLDADVDWREADAADLPFEDDAFDVTLSCLGHMFVTDPGAAGTELVRVTRPGGRIGFTSWTLGSAIDEMVDTLVEYLPPRSDAPPSPHRWGDPDTVRERLGDSVEDLRFETHVSNYPALSPAHFWEGMAADSGAVLLALDHVDESERAALDAAMAGTLDPFYSEADNAMELEYQLVTATVPQAPASV